MIKPVFNNFMKAILSSIFGLLSACTPSSQNSDSFVRDLEAAAARLNASEVLRMDAINTGPWDRMFVFPPYTPDQDMEAALGSKLPTSIAKSRLSERDDVNLLVFMNGANVQMVAVVLRSGVDFSTPSTQPISRERASFRKPDSGNQLAWTGRN